MSEVPCKWPKVQPDDGGLRPTAGSPDACFYCKQKIGEYHGPKCVCVTKLVRVRYSFDVEIPVPFDWDEDQINFHYNDSSWCANNALDDLRGMMEKQDCLCDIFEATFLEVVDSTPRLEER